MFLPYPGRALIKWLAIASLAIIVWQQRRAAAEIWLTAALVCHSVGDVLLELDRAKLFLPAVGAFLCGHVLYIVAFWPQIIPRSQLSPSQNVLVLAVVAFGLIVGAILIPRLPTTLLAPISIYIIAISAMALTAIFMNLSASLRSESTSFGRRITSASF
jgi:uncharacterized membrane protein YhhN